jgi:hypothetical protein
MSICINYGQILIIIYMQYINFINSHNVTDRQLLESIKQGYSTLFENGTKYVIEFEPTNEEAESGQNQGLSKAESFIDTWNTKYPEYKLHTKSYLNDSGNGIYVIVVDDLFDQFSKNVGDIYSKAQTMSKKLGLI